jgi:hypothetical protein
MQTAEQQQRTPPRRPYHPFDSLAYAKRMESVGFTRQQAETMAEEQANLIDERLATKQDIELINANIDALRLATNADIDALRLTTKADIDALRLATKADIEQTKFEILKWMFGQTIVIIAAIVGIMRVGIH